MERQLTAGKKKRVSKLEQGKKKEKHCGRSRGETKAATEQVTAPLFGPRDLTV